jgi:threonine aldolase
LRVVDLRSDTVTLPTREMLEVIPRSPLGDDVFREDPTVNRLEEMAAKRVGKEAALLVTSGTQGNLTSLMTHTKRGDEVILEAESHMYYYEVGGLSALGGVMARPVKGTMGVLDPRDVEGAIRPADIHCPPTTLICIENTHNRAGGVAVSPSQIRAVADVARRHGISTHMDGARVFNAAVALGVDVKELTREVDSVMFCLSKGLGAPVGSLVCGTSEFVERARRVRKMLGGGMRKAGVIAAPGIIALEKMVDRLRDDHRNARLLAEGLARIRGISVNMKTVQTNIVVFDISGTGMNTKQLISKLEERGVKAISFGEKLMRMVTHWGIEREDVEYALSVVEKVLAD